MINVGEIVIDPDFVQGFTYLRRKITWVNGRKTITEEQYSGTGTIIPDTSKSMDNTPQGVNLTGNITLWTHETLLVTQENSDVDYLSDVVIYKGERYILFNDRNLSEYGYNRYTGVRESTK